MKTQVEVIKVQYSHIFLEPGVTNDLSEAEYASESKDHARVQQDLSDW